MSFDGETLSIGAGGGITLLSKPDEEYEETLAKAERLFQTLEGPAQADEEAAA
jgi:anthranilate/para-aminobenzoate synthase component I